MSGYKGEESEEMVAKVISVVDSPQHFEEQAVVLLEQVKDRNWLPGVLREGCLFYNFS